MNKLIKILIFIPPTVFLYFCRILQVKPCRLTILNGGQFYIKENRISLMASVHKKLRFTGKVRKIVGKSFEKTFEKNSDIARVLVR